jgi:predicted RNA-binding Zn-ribbon protein involved in translation (DUF1610 family)
MLSETKVEPKMKTTVGRLKCPNCGHLNWGVIGRGNPPNFQCNKCEGLFPESRWEVVEVEVDAYECPNCGRLVADSQENYSIGVWAGPEPVLVCPECLTIIRGYLHHEDPSGASIIIEVDEKGGYMHVFHKGCSKAQNGLGYMRLRRMCVDPETKQWLRKHGYKGEPGSRVVLVYVCEDCGAQQVVKAGLKDTRIWNTYTERWWKP